MKTYEKYHLLLSSVFLNLKCVIIAKFNNQLNCNFILRYNKSIKIEVLKSHITESRQPFVCY